MKRIQLTVAFLAPVLAAATTVQAAGKPGELWETQLTVTSAQHGEMAMPAQRICQPPANRDPKGLLPQMSEDCPGLTLRQQADRITWSGKCKQGKTEGEMRFIGTDRMEGRMKMATAQGEFSMQFKGRKLGSCKQEAE